MPKTKKTTAPKEKKASAKKPASPAVKRTASEKTRPARKAAMKAKPAEEAKTSLEPSGPQEGAHLEVEGAGVAAEKVSGKDIKNKFIEAVGRRKNASARVRLFTQGTKDITVNGKPYELYFPIFGLQRAVEDPLRKLNILGKFGFSILVRGGGLTGQAEAARHGIARTLVLLNPYFKKRLKKTGLLTRDSRMRERKKPGLKRARRAPQWSKR